MGGKEPVDATLLLSYDREVRMSILKPLSRRERLRIYTMKRQLTWCISKSDSTNVRMNLHDKTSKQQIYVEKMRLSCSKYDVILWTQQIHLSKIEPQSCSSSKFISDYQPM